jgi:hypothetical protein
MRLVTVLRLSITEPPRVLCGLLRQTRIDQLLSRYTNREIPLTIICQVNINGASTKVYTTIWHLSRKIKWYIMVSPRLHERNADRLTSPVLQHKYFQLS